jgi:hypothetical protein
MRGIPRQARDDMNVDPWPLLSALFVSRHAFLGQGAGLPLVITDHRPGRDTRQVIQVADHKAASLSSLNYHPFGRSIRVSVPRAATLT